MAKKMSKRLICAIASLVVSVVLCVGICIAWFAQNDSVNGNGLGFQLRGDDIVAFNAVAYFLEYDVESGAYSLAATGNCEDFVEEVDADGNGVIDEGDSMRPYATGGGYTTAILFKINYEFVGDSEKTFRIFCECPTDTRIAVSAVGGTDDFESYLSNAVRFANAEKEGDGYAAQSSEFSFVNSDHEKRFHLDFVSGIDKNNASGINADGNCYGEQYVIMDYEADRFAYLSSLLLESGGGLSSELTLSGDLTLGIEEYDEDVEIAPVSLASDELAPNRSHAYSQTVGSDTISHAWQFVVTYSDGSKKVIVSTNDGISISDINTQVVGKHTANVTYTEGAKSVECTVEYVVGMVIGGGSGVAKGDTLSLSVSGLSSGSGLTWSVEDGTGSATIDQTTGVLTGVTEGTVTVTVVAEGYVDDQTTPQLKATSVVTVTAEKVSVSGVTLNRSSLSLTVGDRGALSATVAPTNATNKAVTWSVSPSGIVSVSDGVVAALAAGSATITVTTADGGYTATCSVTVKAATVAVTGVSISGANTVTEGESITLTATVSPDNATDKAVTWSVTNGTGSATVTQSGVLTGSSAGTVTVTATAGGKSATHTVTVKAATVAVTGVTLDKSTATLKVGNSVTLVATVAPDGATDKTITWSSSKEEVATVSGGVVTAVSAGEATITVTTEDGNKTATCVVTVEESSTTPVQTEITETVTLSTGYSLGDELLTLQDGETTIATVKTNCSFSKKDSGGCEPGSINCLTINLNAGYTYTITLNVGSSGSSARTITLNGVGQSSGASTTDFVNATWTITPEETADYSTTESGKIRLYSITIAAFPVSD